MSETLLYYRINVVSTINLITAMLAHGGGLARGFELVRDLWHTQLSSIDEMAPLRPISPYGWTELAGEQIAADAGAPHGMQYAFEIFQRRCRGTSGELAERHFPEPTFSYSDLRTIVATALASV